MSLKLTFLGTGTSTGVPEVGCTCPVCTSSDPRDKRLRVSVLLEQDDTRILIDCGPDFRAQMMTQPFKKIDAVLLTHEHYDHTGGIDDLRPFCSFGDINIFADFLTCQHLRERLPYMFREVLYPGVPRLNFQSISPFEPFYIHQIPVLPLEIMHGQLPILGYRIGDLGFVTDMLTAPAETYKALHGVRVLVINGLRYKPHGSHQTIDMAIDFAHQVEAQETYLIHMSHHAGLHQDLVSTLPSDIHIAYDGLQININKI